MLSVVTNACAGDEVRLRHTLPNWLRVFGDRLSDLVIVVDEEPASGRIAALHGQTTSLTRLFDELMQLQAVDRRIRITSLGARTADETLTRWFGSARPIRCQAGTPIFAFVQAIEEAAGPIVLRCDCDMLFHDAGWVEAAIQLLSLESPSVDVLEPARLGMPSMQTLAVSSRAFVVNNRVLGAKLPMPAHRLDPARRLHRMVFGRPPWLALEQTLDKQRLAGDLRHTVLDPRLGYSMHVTTREHARLEWFDRVVALVEAGEIPDAQREHGPNFFPPAWAPVAPT